MRYYDKTIKQYHRHYKVFQPFASDKDDAVIEKDEMVFITKEDKVYEYGYHHRGRVRHHKPFDIWEEYRDRGWKKIRGSFELVDLK